MNLQTYFLEPEVDTSSLETRSLQYVSMTSRVTLTWFPDFRKGLLSEMYF